MSSAMCTICSAAQEFPKVFTTVDGAAFLECPRCGFVWLDKQFWPQDQEKHYSTEYYGEEYQGRHNLAELFAYRFKLLKQYLPSPGMVLEVGAASGDFLSLLKNAGYEVSGVELSSRAATQAKERYGLDLFRGTLEDAKFPDAHFDYVVMYHVLEHVPEPRATLREIYRILKPGGRVLFEVPNVRSIDARFSQTLLKNVLDYPHHLYAFSRSTLRSLVTEEGFALVALQASVPYSIARAITRLRRRKVPLAGVEQKQESGLSGKVLFDTAKPDSVIKRGLTALVPGMKITLVGQKPML